MSDCSDCSDCSDLSYVETVYSLDELHTMGVIDNKFVDWIKENPLSPDDPILLLEYHDQNVANRENEIRDALVAHGGTPITSTVFKFDTRDQVYLAQENMRVTHTWAFYSLAFDLVRKQPVQQFVALPKAPTISTTFIHFYSESRFQVDNEYEFFMI
uniref:Uncharacterized protein n=1 Tax=Panagrolaimus davidi TaxID=227884 RepID=A0A914PA80_9BILA